MKTSRLEQINEGREEEIEQFKLDVLNGFESSPKQLSARYFYDDRGSELFRAITQQEDYYLTRTEFDILSANKQRIAGLVDEKEIDIIELGAGDGHKSQLVIDGFLEAGCAVDYYPIDISEKAMDLLSRTINRKSGLTLHGLIGEYFDGLRFVKERSGRRQLVMFLGSNIGNFNRMQNQGFLRRLWSSLNPGDFLLIGFDLKKDIDVLVRAYSDSGNVTRDFNLNLLVRINRELGGNFQVEKFQHYAVYNPILGAMESFLISREKQSVYIESLQREFLFHAHEPIHLEYSFKFLPSDIDYLAGQTGYEVVESLTDARHWFIDSLWRVSKQSNSAKSKDGGN